MKKIFFVAIAATLLAAGCQKTEVINQVNPVDGTSMTFAPNLGQLTKVADADSSGTYNLSEQDFRLWAYYVADDPNRGADANDVYDGMSNIIISDGPEGNAGKEWKANTTHFWPGRNKKLKFFAISANPDTYGTGEGTTATNSKVTVNPEDTTMTVSNFIVAPSAPNTDLMVADYVEAAQGEGKDGSKNTVDFTFRHALTKVQFSFKNSETTMPVYVQQMFVEGIKTTGNLTVATTKNNKGLAAMSWTTSDATDTFYGDYVTVQDDGTFETPKKAENYDTAWKNEEGADIANIASNGYMKLTNTYKPYTTWLVIPQDVYNATENTDLKVTIAYVIVSDTEIRQFIQTFSLGSASLVPSWDKNQYVRYNINLTPNIIGFSATVAPWDETSEGSNKGDVNINE